MSVAVDYGRGEGEGFIDPPGAGDMQFVSSAVVEPDCETALPDGEFDAEPLL